MQIDLTVNGKRASLDVEPRLLLAHALRDSLNLTGTHIGCDTSSCGACTVLLDGKSVKSCTVFAVQAAGHDSDDDRGDRHRRFAASDAGGVLVGARIASAATARRG